MKKIFVVIIPLLFILVSCSTFNQEVEDLRQENIELKAQVEVFGTAMSDLLVQKATLSAMQSQTPAVIIVTPIETRAPEVTATASPTPTETPPPAPTITINPNLISTKTKGYYLVNIEIAPGVWRSDGTNPDQFCFWERTTASGETIDIYAGQPGGTIYIAPTDFQVRFEDCGNWIYIKGP